MKTFKLHLIRHGITAGNLQGLYIGSGTDLPLCDEGRAQLADLKERFDYRQHPVPRGCPPVYGARPTGGRFWQV